jgi:protein-S-isoprenylcysteine O-methyltransferase Ste14
MIKFIIFGFLSILVIILSWRSLFNLKSHGFYRFLSWECMIWLLSCNYKFWFTDPFGIRQLLSWTFLIVSAFMILAGVIMMRKIGKPARDRNDKTLYRFEQTSQLVDRGIFNYIRHPLYASLLFLTWGIYLKHITLPLLVVALLSTVFLYLTAIADEKECMVYFGDSYKDYMKRSKRFIPYLF